MTVAVDTMYRLAGHEQPRQAASASLARKAPRTSTRTQQRRVPRAKREVRRASGTGCAAKWRGRHRQPGDRVRRVPRWHMQPQAATTCQGCVDPTTTTATRYRARHVAPAPTHLATWLHALIVSLGKWTWTRAPQQLAPHVQPALRARWRQPHATHASLGAAITTRTQLLRVRDALVASLALTRAM